MYGWHINGSGTSVSTSSSRQFILKVQNVSSSLFHIDFSHGDLHNLASSL